MSGEQKHQYHLVEPSPWPALGSAAGFTLFLGLTLFMHEYPFSIWVLGAGLFMVLATMFYWWRDIVREAEYQGHHTPIVQIGMRYGMIFFICSEVMFFVAFFWAFFDSSLYPDTGVWPPEGIEAQYPYRPSTEDLHKNGKNFPPNFLHKSWMDYLYWDVELEA